MKTKPFRMKADIIFKAKDITDAMRLLAKHFTDIKKGIDSKLLEGGEIEVRSFGFGEPYNRSLLSGGRNHHLEFPVHVWPGAVLTVNVDFQNDQQDMFIVTDVEIHGQTRISKDRLIPELEVPVSLETGDQLVVKYVDSKPVGHKVIKKTEWVKEINEAGNKASWVEKEKIG
jgi:hypothetical protein